jgi:RHS repeat-associated protein
MLALRPAPISCASDYLTHRGKGRYGRMPVPAMAGSRPAARHARRRPLVSRLLSPVALPSPKGCSQGGVLSRKAVWLAGLVVFAVLAFPGLAAASCTKTWVGGTEGIWGTAANWSPAGVPSATDVTCIASGDTVNVTENASQTGSLVVAGTLTIPSGYLEVVSTVEASSVANLSIEHGTLINAGVLAVSGTFTGGEGGVLKGLGTTLIESGAKATITEVGSLFVEEQTFENAGTLSIGKKSAISGSKKMLLANSGTLILNGETLSELHGLIAGENEASLVNTGVIEKAEGTGASPIEFVFDNEGKVSVTSGEIELTGGGASGKGAVGSWSASGKETGVMFNGGVYTLGEKVPMSGAVEIYAGKVTAGVIEGAEANMTINGAFIFLGAELELTGKTPSTLEGLTLAHKEANDTGGTLQTKGQVNITRSFTGGGFSTFKGTGTLLIEPEAKGTVSPSSSASFALSEGTLKNTGTFTIGVESGLSANKHAKLENTGTLIVNGETGANNHGLAAAAGEATLINTSTGTIKKTEGAGITAMEFATDNEGKILVTSGRVEFLNGGKTGEHPGSWAVSGGGTEIIFGQGTIELGSTVALSGAFSTSEGTVIAGTIEGSEASLTITKVKNGIAAGVVEINGSTPSTLKNLTVIGVGGEFVGGGKQGGTGEVDITGTFTTGKQGYLTGAGSTVIEPGATGVVEALEGLRMTIEARTLVNKGTLTSPIGTGIQGIKHPLILNAGTFILNGETEGEDHGLISAEGEAKIVNTGTIKKTEGTGETPIQWELENLGMIIEETGRYKITDEVKTPSEMSWGGGNPSAPGQEPPECGDPVNCATGNFHETQTDLAIGGRGVGLDLIRTYNSQAGAASIQGTFGYGWSNSFSDHLTIEKATATLHQANGSTVPFIEGSGESFTPPAWSQDSLHGSAKLGYSLVLANQVKYQFDGATGRLVSVSDRNGNQTKIGYAAKGLMETITDPAGRKITLAYNSEGVVESAKDPMGNTVKYTYEAGNLKSVTEPGEAKPRWQYGYDGSHQVTSITDGRGGKTTNEYDETHRVKTQTDPAEHKLTFEYEPFRTKITNNTTGSITDEHFTSNNEPVSITRGFGTSSASTETFAYDAANNLESVTDGNGHKTKYTYDTTGDRLSMVDADEHETKWTYDQTHDVLTVTTPNGETTTISRDSRGNAETISRPAPGAATQTTTFHYDPQGDVTSVVDPLKHTSNYEYNSQGDCTGATDPAGDKRTFAYNEDSRQTSNVSPAGNVKGAEASQYTTKIERDAQGRPITFTDPLGHTTKIVYDANGNIETETDPNGHTTIYTYNADNERTKTKEPSGTTTETGYDGSGRVTSQIDGNKHTITYVRNPVGEATEIKDALGRVTKKEYDAAGNLTAVTDAAKHTTKYSYDPANRLKEVAFSDGKTPTIKYEYDADGNRTKMTDGTGKTTYTYDLLDRLVQNADGHGDKTGYEYDLAGEQTKLTYPNGTLISRAFDNAGRLQSVTDPSKNTTTFAYDPNSNPTTTTFPKGTNEQDKIAYNHADQQLKITMTGNGLKVLASVLYARDNDGQIKTTTTTGLPGTASLSYVYDTNSRLSSAGATSYEYDAADNPTKLGATTNTYDAASQLKTGGSTSYGYDQLGERTTATPQAGQATTYGYDQAGNLIQVKQGKAGGLNDNYAYDGNSLRVSQSKGKTTSFITWDTHGGIPVILSDEQNSYVYGPDSIPIEEIQSKGLVLYLHHDQLGSTRMLTSSTGAIEATMTYDAYGNLTATTGTTTTPIGYTGQYTNADSGLLYLRARAYDPATAQFLTTDPINPVTRAPYNYTYDNPVNATDPTGYWCTSFNIHCLGEDAGDAVGVGSRVGATLLHASTVGQGLQIASDLTGTTVGVCAGAGFVGGGSLHGSACYVSSPNGQSAITYTGGGGAGFPIGIGGFLGPTISNAQSPSELAGWFSTAGVSAGDGPFSAGGWGSVGQNACGQGIWQAGLGWTPNQTFPVPASFYAGPSYSFVYESF